MAFAYSLPSHGVSWRDVLAGETFEVLPMSRVSQWDSEYMALNTVTWP